MEAPVIVQEGLAQRARAGAKGWICVNCNHVMSFVSHDGGCPNCKTNNICEIKSQERLHEETEALKDKERFHYWQPESFNPQSWESQMGQALTADQVLTILRKWIPGAKMFPQVNPTIKKWLMAYYIPWTWSLAEEAYISNLEKVAKLKFICCGEPGIMPEWDVLPLDEERRSLPPIRGWRSILGIFYRGGYIPFVPDDGTRLGWWQIRESPIERKV